jgi:hypothetical protein
VARLFFTQAILLSCTPLGFGGCHEPLTEGECNRMLGHYVDLIVHSDRPGTSTEELLRMQKEARQQAADDPAFRRCSSDVSRPKYECALRATTTDKLEQCIL